ncbi:Cupredoxin-like domain-containing protein [Seinonella peptonophila]|uniref:Cupredoxin-like domain-containing protein n=1 Tax=Seinonella peptonophila TaxID=112248 RepID=A0A1M5AMZ7_9BACL|nr:cupredoxin domain-containing protein [Seinonella peptonophila]SHF31603.1 Cupredoxin-like domain-containing protein [Seinonella peptonophila]
MLKSYRFWGYLLICFALGAFLLQSYLGKDRFSQGELKPVQEFHLFTVEFKSHGTEVYRWDPGTIVVKKEQPVRLHLHGLNGAQHHFSIPDTQVRGVVQKGQVTTVEFTPTREGTYPLICHNHQNATTQGPMIGYIQVVDD